MNDQSIEAAPASDGSPTAAPPHHEGRRRARRPYRLRRYAAGLLVVLFSLCLLVSVVSIWGVRQVLNTNVFVSHISTAIKDPDVQSEIATYVSNEVIRVVDPAPKIASILPPKAQPLVDPIVAGLHTVVEKGVKKLLATPAFQKILLTAIGKAHAAAVALLEGKTKGTLVIDGNAVVLNVLPMLDDTLNSLQQQGPLAHLLSHVPPAIRNATPSQQIQLLSHALGVKLPATFGQIVVFRSKSLHQAQVGLKKVHRGLIFLLVVTALMFVLALVVAPFRLRTLAQLGVGAGIVGFVTWAGTRWATNHVVQIATSDRARSAVRAVIDAETSGLIDAALLIVLIGVVVAVLAFVFGASPQAGSTRAAAKEAVSKLPAAGRSVKVFVDAHVDGVRVLGVVVGVVILLIWLSWTALFVAAGVVALWQIGVSRLEASDGAQAELADHAGNDPRSGVVPSKQ